MTARLLAVALAAALFASGCVRRNFNRCEEPNPPADCDLVDFGPFDAGPRDAADQGT